MRARYLGRNNKIARVNKYVIYGKDGSIQVYHKCRA